MSATLRPAKQSDFERIAPIHTNARATAMPWLPEVHTAEEDLWYFANALLPEETAHVAKVDGQVIGYSAYANDWLTHLYLDPSFQRRGIGSALLQNSKTGHDELNLWVFQRNIAAQAFYQTHGFIEVMRTDGSRNEEKTPDIHLRWTRN